MAVSLKPLIVLTCTPGKGHTNPIKILAKALVLDGYEVTAVSSSYYRKTFEDVGCSYVAIKGYGDYWDGERETRWPERAFIPPGPEQFAFTIEHSFVRVIPDQFAAVQKAIQGLKDKNPGRPVIVLNESAFLGSLPFKRGARGVKPDGIIGLGINPVNLNSRDTAPFGPGLPPPTSEAEVAQYAEIRKQIEHGFYTKAQAAFNDIMKELGAAVDDGFCFDAPYLWPDRFLQMCPPSTQYPRSDAPKSFSYAGGLPKLPADPKATPPERPSWWGEVIYNPSKKDIVFVCQGTVVFDYATLVIPTMEALQDRPNTLVVVVLGERGATLDPSITVPENVRVADYIPFDDILPFVHVFVGNGGYGGVQHSIAQGTPLVVAGDTEDKTEMCAIAAWAGVAVNLRTGRPTVEALRAGIDEVLSSPKYKRACQKIQDEIKTFDPLRVVTAKIDEVVAGVEA
ncbi:hypothetical protein OQA88_7928 [Cercophora sp. LCS_1]